MARFMAGVLAAVVATAVVGVGSAQAKPDELVCVFTGLAGNIIDDANGAAGIPSAQKDLSDLNPIDIEPGVYQFGGQGTCAARQGALNYVGPAPIVSAGEYENVLCGTGWALDLAGANTSVRIPPPIGWAEPFGYEIPFAAGNGPILIGTRATAPSHLGSPIGGDYVGHGYAHIQPVAPDNCVTTDTNEFSVAGAFAAVRRPVG